MQGKVEKNKSAVSVSGKQASGKQASGKVAIATGGKIRVRQVRSLAGRSENFRRVVESLGLGRIGREQILPANVTVLGAVAKAQHILKVEKLS